ncbi:MAG: hypothetical protein Q7K45_02985 [Nanoarchaeota archaeon]|nr:hypothetical protein [Nanoarchaeota archaeon]
MGPITREVLQQGLLEYLAIMVLFEPGKERVTEERGAMYIEPKDIAAIFEPTEYIRMYKANAPVLASMLQSPEEKRRELAYAIHGAHLKVTRAYDEQKESGQRKLSL